MLALALVTLAVGSDHLDVTSLSTTGLVHAHQYLDELERSAGGKLSEYAVDVQVKSMIDIYYRSLNDPKSDLSKPLERVKTIRSFVKKVGPILGKKDHAEDGPLHDVLARAKLILGIEDEPEAEKLHPHIEARRILSGMALFMSKVKSAHADGGHEEL
tara:strand:- start:769 stop:1242 length:474 start_codon:yes stop_codon:yes gene_type:complete